MKLLVAINSRAVNMTRTLEGVGIAISITPSNNLVYLANLDFMPGKQSSGLDVN